MDPQSGGMTIKLPMEIERRLTRTLSEVRSLAASRGQHAEFDAELRLVAEAVRDAVWWQSRGLAEHALRAMDVLSEKLDGAAARPVPDAGASEARGHERGSCPAHLSARLRTLAAHARHVAEAGDLDGALRAELEVVDRTVQLALHTDSRVAAESALKLVRAFAKGLPAAQNAVARIPQIGRVATHERPSTLEPADHAEQE